MRNVLLPRVPGEERLADVDRPVLQSNRARRLVVDDTLIYGPRDHVLTVLYAAVRDYRDTAQPQAKRLVRRADGLAVLPVERPSYWHRAVEVEFETLNELADVLRILEVQSTAFCVPGLLTAHARTLIENGEPILRRALPVPGAPATLADEPKACLIVDVDAAWLDVSVDVCIEPETAATALRNACLGPMCTARCVVQLSASTGVRKGEVSGHIAYMLDVPRTLAEQKRGVQALIEYEKRTNPRWKSPLDLSLTRPAQPIYTAAPLLVDIDDPCPVRVVELPGEEVLKLNVPPEPERKKRQRMRYRTGQVGTVETPRELRDVETTLEGRQFLRDMRERIVAAMHGSRHPTIRNSAYLGAGRVATGQIALADLRDALLAVAPSVYGDEWDVRERSVRAAIEWGIERGLEAPISDELEEL